MKTTTKIMGFLMTVLLALSAPLVYADNGNGGNVGGDQPAASDDQSSPGQGDHAWGDHWGKHGDHRRGGFFKDLTDDQKKQLKDIFQKQRTAKKTAFEQIKADKEDLTNELLQTTPDTNKINDLKSKLEALQAQLLDNRINSDLDVKKILNAEQFARYLEFQKHKFHRGKWGHNGEGWGHLRHCRHHHRHHHGNWGDQRDDGYGEHHGHGYDNGDNE
jgi:Spy/CpxP family protein refolding chaperone